ncbi:hypothetical protein SAMN06295909_3104 [Plantibacter sp. VKM Ac-1784]|uniref:Uncharacterized protein n=1 Tax=Plantibacter elymi (nom. nud.) TaxID=199708 RepID=A0ABY1RFN3_9MICO|nr:hypothetical protein [Plantibacter sp. VKM Ac-1784]SMQ73118.1 hypothetical protein SAMN06295909_3104 [Plantibacter sp. VKM Ac-1784]
MGTVTHALRQPILWVLLAIAAAYVTVVLLFDAFFEGSCQESYPARCPVMELEPAALVVTALLLLGIAAVAGVLTRRPRSRAQAALLLALFAASIVLSVAGFHLSLSPAWEIRY